MLPKTGVVYLHQFYMSSNSFYLEKGDRFYSILDHHHQATIRYCVLNECVISIKNSFNKNTHIWTEKNIKTHIFQFAKYGRA